MGESSQPGSPRHSHGEEAGDERERASSALSVLAGPVQATPAQAASSALPDERRPVIPAVQAAAVAAGGFVAGAAVVGLVHRRHRRAGALTKGTRAGRRAAHIGGRGSGRTAELVQIVSSRSLLVDVHLLGGSPER
jgi:hypothetical protein